MKIPLLSLSLPRLALALLFAVGSSASLTIAQTLYAPGGTVGTSSTGNVGIGTSTPDARLHVYSATGSYEGNLLNFASQPDPSFNLTLRSVVSSGAVAYFWDMQNTSGNVYSNMLVFKTGRVGIGTADPVNKLDVRYGITAATTDYVESSSGSKISLQLNAATGNVPGFIQACTAGATAFGNIALNPSGGNVGIGTTGPATKLQLAGDNVELGMGHSTGDGNVYTRLGMTSSFDTYWTTNATYNGTSWNYISTDGWNGAASRIDQAGGSITFDTVSGGTNPITWSTRLFVGNNGNVGIGTTNPGIYKLAVNGTIHAKGVVVNQTGWSDYVFKPGYHLPSLREVEAHIQTHGTLPGVPSEAEVAKEGVNLGDMQARLLAKVEELTLHLIRLDKENTALRREVEMLKAGR